MSSILESEKHSHFGYYAIIVLLMMICGLLILKIFINSSSIEYYKMQSKTICQMENLKTEIANKCLSLVDTSRLELPDMKKLNCSLLENG